MKDIPFFTTEYGVASLSLGQIPYRGTAYVQVRSCVPGHLAEHVAECAGFCRAAGADEVFWTGEDIPEQPHSVICEMRGCLEVNPEFVESLFPVTEQTATQWRKIHNDRMENVDHAAYLTEADEKKLLNAGAYFIHRNGGLIGIGWLDGDTIRAIASVQPGAGGRIVHTLMSLTQGDIRLEVASTNARAIRLYERLGFIKTGEIRRWCRA